MQRLDDSNFVLFAAKHYDNPSCISEEEFMDDLSRFKYIKRLFTKYQETGELRERLIINHLVVLYNLFGPETTRMLFFKLDGYWPLLKPFVVFMGRMPEEIQGVGSHPVVKESEIPMDKTVVEVLRNL